MAELHVMGLKFASPFPKDEIDKPDVQRSQDTGDPCRRLFHDESASIITSSSPCSEDEAVGLPLPVLERDTRQAPLDGNKFKSMMAEFGFCFSIAMTQFLAEYLISGFALELPRLLSSINAGSTGQFWPASLLSLILSATLLIFARISDMYGGYLPFMFGLWWLTVWSTIAGISRSADLLDVSRAMQGMAIAAFTPATFTMLGSTYPPGPRKNVIFGLYSCCAPLGFFTGFLTAGSLPAAKSNWYFFVAAGLSLTTTITAYLTVPDDAIQRDKLGLQMDWLGSFFITAGLILLAYALAAEPFTPLSPHSGFASPTVLAPLIGGGISLCFAFWIEGWVAACPLLPFTFFQPRGTKPFAITCLCCYATYAVWLYGSVEYFQLPAVIGRTHGIHGLELAAWYAPTAIGGIALCVVGGAVLHRVPAQILLVVSVAAWVIGPLLLAVAPRPLHYWAVVMPSMLCATLGIDLTFTVSLVYLSAVQPLRSQGLTGAVCAILVNLAMSFALSVAEMVEVKARQTYANSSVGMAEEEVRDAAEIWGLRATFIYAALSAGVGFGICTLCVNVSKEVGCQQRQRENGSGSEA